MALAEPLSGFVQPELQYPETASNAEVKRFLRFLLRNEITVLLPLDCLIEVIKIKLSHILPIPTVSDHLLGITNWRGEAVWILDLPYLLGFAHLAQQVMVPEVGTAILIQAARYPIGLLVDQVNSIDVYDFQALQPLSAEMIHPKLLPFLQGYFTDPTGKMLMLLNVDAVIRSFRSFHG
jgi:positive phototaxis protein PixI